MKESRIERHLVQQANKYGFLCWKFLPFQLIGVPDRILIGHGHTVFVETKKPGELLRKIQKERHRQIKNHGGTVFVVDRSEAIDKMLRKLIINSKTR